MSAYIRDFDETKYISFLTKDDDLLEKYNEIWEKVINSIKKEFGSAAKSSVISPNLQVWKFCGKVQFSHCFGRFAQNYAETVPFHKISTPGN